MSLFKLYEITNDLGILGTSRSADYYHYYYMCLRNDHIGNDTLSKLMVSLKKTKEKGILFVALNEPFVKEEDFDIYKTELIHNEASIMPIKTSKFSMRSKNRVEIFKCNECKIQYTVKYCNGFAEITTDHSYEKIAFAPFIREGHNDTFVLDT